MKTTLFYFLTVILGAWPLWLGLGLSSCEPIENPIILEPVITQIDLLTAHVWNFDTLTTTCSDPEFILSTSICSESYANGICNFYANGVYTMTLIYQEHYGTWSFNTDETEISFSSFYNAPFILTTTVFEFKNIVYPGSEQEFDMTWRWVN